MKRAVISDTSCLIALERINRLDLLQQIFEEIITTSTVAKEFASELPEWIKIRHVKNLTKQKELENIIDPGEASAIALALEYKNCILIIDEKKGRSIASNLHIKIIGTLKTILLAKQKGVITTVKTVINQLYETGFRFNEKIVDEILIEANEK